MDKKSHIGTELEAAVKKLSFDGAVEYHYDQFPADSKLDYERLIDPISRASGAINRFDQMLKTMHNNDILLAPLRKQEAVISSRMEGTISTMDEILSFEADQDDDGENVNPSKYRPDVIETWLYSSTLKRAQGFIMKGRPINEWLIRAMHQELLKAGRGALKSPGKMKEEQNYVVDRTQRKVTFIPIAPEKLNDGLEILFKYINDSKQNYLLKTAMSHVEFESLHPFQDGNGRIGRMLITLYLWKAGAISSPHFYISGYFEEHKNEYIDALRNVSKDGEWTEWCIFFLNALEKQAINNLQIAESIQALYKEMKTEFRELLGTEWHLNALDFMFTNPIFRNNKFTNKEESGIPKATASKFTRRLLDRELLKTIEEPSGRKPGLYRFEPLMKLVRV